MLKQLLQEFSRKGKRAMEHRSRIEWNINSSLYMNWWRLLFAVKKGKSSIIYYHLFQLLIGALLSLFTYKRKAESKSIYYIKYARSYNVFHSPLPNLLQIAHRIFKTILSSREYNIYYIAITGHVDILFMYVILFFKNNIPFSGLQRWGRFLVEHIFRTVSSQYCNKRETI